MPDLTQDDPDTALSDGFPEMTAEDILHGSEGILRIYAGFTDRDKWALYRVIVNGRLVSTCTNPRQAKHDLRHALARPGVQR